ncbi:MAG: 4a-hydroxytetrahydrobiopterin dehydratase [Nanohaloarchaea archaeon]|nr:4a-hydroxytetrahydrobiopterin dehydratase [Candidatus Nanohaloarchaea archaeon]
MAERLEDEELKEALEDLEIWGLEAGKLSTRIEFDDYKKSVFFANTVFTLAESHFHHPEVKVEYGAVEIDLWSHEEEAITEKDIELAEEITEKVRSIDW